MSSWLSWMATQGFLPHGYCLQWQEGLVGLMVGSDIAIALSYYSIPAALVVLFHRKRDLQFGWVFVLFSLFIFSCGTTHVISLLNIWWPMYWVEGYVKALTAAVSALTAILLWPLIPRIVRLPTTRQLEELVQRLEEEVAQRRRAEEELQALAQELERRVLERTHQLKLEVAERLRLQDADKAREIAERANRAKSEFLSRMSHELRTPLNAVLGFSALMQRQDGGLSEQKILEWSGHIERAGKHLLRLVNDVLDIGRIESGTVTLQQEPVRIGELAAESHSMVLSAAQSAGVSVSHEVRADLVVHTDAGKLRQALLNLLMNGIKYNRQGGTVSLTIDQPEATHLQVEVRDSGIGMSPEQVAQLFEPFNRLGRERSGVEGVGLGLVVVKHLVELVGGQLHVESEAGAGTAFRFTWPVSIDGERATAPATPD